jgi:CHAT domain-containing protein
VTSFGQTYTWTTRQPRLNSWENAEQYSILHLATHSKANDRLGDQAFLAFTALDDDEENEILYNRDLYNLQLNADMVVLSACETGIGELQKRRRRHQHRPGI